MCITQIIHCIFALQELFKQHGTAPEQFLRCVVRTYEWQQEQRGAKTDSKPFLAYYWALKHLSPAQDSPGQPSTPLQRWFLAWVKRWVDDEDFQRLVHPMWLILSDIQNSWQHEAHRNGNGPNGFVDEDQPSVNPCTSAAAGWNAEVQPMYAAQRFQGHQAVATPLPAEMRSANANLVQPGNATEQVSSPDWNALTPLLPLPALDEGAGQIGLEQGCLFGSELHSEQNMADEVRNLFPTATGQHMAQQNLLPEVQHMPLGVDPGIIHAEQTSGEHGDAHPHPHVLPNGVSVSSYVCICINAGLMHSNTVQQRLRCSMQGASAHIVQ